MNSRTGSGGRADQGQFEQVPTPVDEVERGPRNRGGGVGGGRRQ